MEALQTKLETTYGYKLGIDEIFGMYTDGELTLTDAEENTLLEAVEKELN